MSQKNAKELNPEYIEIQDEHLEGNKKSGNYWFRRFKYLGKLYIQMTKNKKAINSEYVIYYCHFHRTLIKSTKLSKNGEKKDITNVIAVYFIINILKNIFVIGPILPFVINQIYLNTKI